MTCWFGAACSSNSNDGATQTTAPTTTTAPASASTIAELVCSELRDFVNTAADIANDAASAVNERTSPTARRNEVLTGFDRLLDHVDLFESRTAGVAATVTAAGNAGLADDLVNGVLEARAELVDERAAFALLNGIEDDDERGRVGQFFNALEKALSVVEPSITEYATSEVIDAFRAQPLCRHVVQGLQ